MHREDSFWSWLWYDDEDEDEDEDEFGGRFVIILDPEDDLDDALDDGPPDRPGAILVLWLGLAGLSAVALLIALTFQLELPDEAQAFRDAREEIRRQAAQTCAGYVPGKIELLSMTRDGEMYDLRVKVDGGRSAVKVYPATHVLGMRFGSAKLPPAEGGCLLPEHLMDPPLDAGSLRKQNALAGGRRVVDPMLVDR